jgi:SPP1 family predicted phage head-tail adaptor
MLFAETADLIAQTFTVNTVGDSIPTESKRTVFVEMQSIGLKRKIDAMATGLNVEFKLVLKDIAEYEDEKVVEYRSKRYNIQNVFIRDDQCVELTCGPY